eukprot:COSAG06_NODE_58236_length_277_cov_1.443820_1_plen_92_part_11
MPTFQQMTVPAGTTYVMQVELTARWSDAVEVSWQEPPVPEDVVVTGYQVFYRQRQLTDESSVLGDGACIDDPALVVDQKTAGMACDVLAAAY